MTFDTHELDLESAIDRLYVGIEDFYELTEEKQKKEIDKAKNSVQFAALNYMYTGEGIDLVADYISRSNDDLNNISNHREFFIFSKINIFFDKFWSSIFFFNSRW